MSRGKVARGTAIKQIERRRCVACRKIFPKSELKRVVKTSAGEIFFDESGKSQGRGAYLCTSPDCAAVVVKRRNFDKIFKCKVPDELYSKLVPSS